MPKLEIREHARPGRCWIRPRIQPLVERGPGDVDFAGASDVFREGAENRARGGRAPHFNSGFRIQGRFHRMCRWTGAPSQILPPFIEFGNIAGLLKEAKEAQKQGVRFTSGPIPGAEVVLR